MCMIKQGKMLCWGDYAQYITHWGNGITVGPLLNSQGVYIELRDKVGGWALMSGSLSDAKLVCMKIRVCSCAIIVAVCSSSSPPLVCISPSDVHLPTLAYY